MRIFAVFALCALIAACVSKPPPRWVNPEVDPAYWAEDRYDCRRWANRKVEDEVGAAQLDRATDPFSTSTYGGMTARYDVGKREERLFADCMGQKGYVLRRPAEK